MSNSMPQWVHDMNTRHASREPFLAVIAFDRQVGEVVPLADCAKHDIYFSILGTSNMKTKTPKFSFDPLVFAPPRYDEYRTQFQHVLREIKNGNSYLLNLCSASTISSPLDLYQVFAQAEAQYRVYYKNQFVCFSPERFVTISKDVIRSNPMKGTIDATLPDAEKRLLSDEKERAEHFTIVDLIRNDVGIVSDRVDVRRFAYIDKLETNRGPILQMSSEIEGKISSKYQQAIGDLFYAMLPAGSISGAPKKKTIEIIQEVESSPRGYYTGIVVYYDGETVDSGVLIRYIERDADGTLIYRSGGGITYQSELRKEYDEVIKKIYLPISAI